MQTYEITMEVVDRLWFIEHSSWFIDNDHRFERTTS